MWIPKIKDRKILPKKSEETVTKKAYVFDPERRKRSLERIKFNMSRRMASFDDSPLPWFDLTIPSTQ